MKNQSHPVFEWIAHHLRLRGTFSRTDLMEVHGTQRSQAFAHLAQYHAWARANQQPEMALKAPHSGHYVALPQASPTTKEGQISAIMDRESLDTAQALALLDTLRGHCLTAEHNPYLAGAGAFFPVGAHGHGGAQVVEVSSAMHPRLDGADVPTLLVALHRQSCVAFSYATKANQRSQRTVSPHRLIFAGGVYHLRGYCHLKRKMIDFNLARIYGCHEAEAPFVGLHADREWHLPLTLWFEVNPALSADQQSALQRTYPLDGEGQRMVVHTTQALAYYIQQEVLARTMEDPQHPSRRIPCFKR